MTDIDTTAADMLDELISELARLGVELHFAELKGHVKDRLQAYGIYQRLGADHFHPTIGTAVKDYVASHPDVDWRDWEDELGPGAGGSRASGAPRQPDEPGVDPAAGEA